MKKILAFILSLVILSNLTVSVALAQEPKVSLSESESNILKSKLEPEKKIAELTDKEKKIKSLKKEIRKIKNMSDKDYRWSKFKNFVKSCLDEYIILISGVLLGYLFGRVLEQEKISKAFDAGLRIACYHLSDESIQFNNCLTKLSSIYNRTLL